MRVLAGTARGKSLKGPGRTGLRPTSVRVRQSLFDILRPRISGSLFWDVCAGTGAMGIEALSRAAHWVLFSEAQSGAQRLVTQNLSGCGFDSHRYAVWRQNWQTCVQPLARQDTSFDVIYYDPPYQSADYGEFCQVICDLSLLRPTGVLALEHPAKLELPDTLASLGKQRVMGTRSSAVSLYESQAA